MVVKVVEFDLWIVLIEDVGVGMGLIEEFRCEGYNIIGIILS